MKTILKKASVLLPIIILAGCSGDQSSSDSLVIRGSNTVGEELAPRLVDEYKKSHPGVNFDMEFKGSSYGLGALMVDRCDVAATSRPVSTSDVAMGKDRNVDFVDHPIGAYSVAVVVNPNNPVSNLTRQQVRDIFTGAAKNWKDVGGNDAPINVYIRNPISGTHLGFQELACGTNAYAMTAKSHTNYQAIVQAVANDPNGIGYASFNTAKKGAKAVSIDNIAATEANVQKGTYPYARTLHLYTNKNHQNSKSTDFVNFVTSSSGQKVLVEADFVPHP